MFAQIQNGSCLRLAFLGRPQRAPIGDSPLGQVIRRNANRHRVPRQNANKVLADFAGDVGGNVVAILQPHSKLRVGQRLGDLALHLNRFFFGHFALAQRIQAPIRFWRGSQW